MDVETKAKDLQTAEIPKTISLRTENVQPNPVMDVSQSDTNSWRFNQILGMKRHIATIDLTPTSVANDVIYSFSNTPRNVLTMFDAVNLSNYFGFFRYNLVFNIEVQSSFQHVGALIVNQTVLSNPRVMPWIGLPLAIPDIYAKTILPHDFITLGHNGFYTITMPWNCSRFMLPTTGPAISGDAPHVVNPLFDYDMGNLIISVFSPLMVQASVYSTTSIRILAHLENIQYSGYQPNYTI